MRRHNEKTRDMARSALASTARHSSRRRKQVSAQRARARNRARLQRLLAHLDDLDAFEEPLDHPTADRTDRGAIAHRRAHDKLAPLIRWASARTERDEVGHMPAVQLTAHFRGLLGRTTAGRHALDHLELTVIPHPNPYDGWALLPQILLDRAADATDREEQLRATIDVVVATGLVGELNRAIKGGGPNMNVFCPACRRLNRVHFFTFTGDVEAFLAGRSRPLECSCGAPLPDPGPRHAHRVLIRFV